MSKETFVTFDLETTSKNVVDAKICEICIKKINKESKTITEVFHKYVNPLIDIDPEAIKIHGLTNDFLNNHLPFNDIAPMVADFINDSDINGYNIINYDIPVLQKEFDAANVDFVITQNCKILDSYIIFKRDTPRNLEAAYLFYTGNQIKDAHKAAGDVDTTIAVVLKQLEDHPEMSFEELCNYSTYNKELFDINGKFFLDKDGDICLSFGKYKDMKISVIKKRERAYLEWILNLKDFPISSKRILENCL